MKKILWKNERKTKIGIALKVMRFAVLLVLVFHTENILAQNRTRKLNPDEAEYFIKGNLELKKNGEGIDYFLKNTESSSNISFDYEEVREGELTEEEDVSIIFNNATTDYPGGFTSNQLQFWRFDDELGEWQEDRETRQGTANFETSKIMTLMLIIDCSTSLGEHDLEKTKNDAIFFLSKIFELSQRGNIKVGIIGFSKLQDTKVYNIEALNPSTFEQMKSFIKSFTLSNGTALYYSMDMGFEMMQQYIAQNKIDPEKFAAPLMVTFTDGLDQTSTAVDKDILTADQYLEYVNSHVTNAHILGKKLTTYIIGLRGKDITSETQLAKFERIGKKLSDEHYKSIGKIDELRAEFEEIVKDMSRQWSNLTCYVPKGFQGKVGWTFGTEKVQKENRLALLGLNLGFGGGLSDQTKFLDFSAGLDFAITVKKNFAIGIYASYKTTFNNIKQGSYGVSLLLGPKDKAFLLGMGLNQRHRSDVSFEQEISGYPLTFSRRSYDSCDFDLRLGGVFKVVYFFFDFAIGKYATNDYSNFGEYLRSDKRVLAQLNFNLGVNFIRFKKKK